MMIHLFEENILYSNRMFFISALISSVHVVCGNSNFHEYNPGTRTHEYLDFPWFRFYLRAR